MNRTHTVKAWQILVAFIVGLGLIITASLFIGVSTKDNETIAKQKATISSQHETIEAATRAAAADEQKINTCTDAANAWLQVERDNIQWDKDFAANIFSADTSVTDADSAQTVADIQAAKAIDCGELSDDTDS